MRLYLNVPYSEKDEAKALGAKWNAKAKKWFIIEGKQKCWKCGNITTVVGFGIGEFVHIYGEAETPQYEIVEDYIDSGEE